VPGRSYALVDPMGTIAGIRKARLRINRRGTGRLLISANNVDLSHAQQTSHRVTTELASGTYDQSDDRVWESASGRLGSQL